jgi:phosphoribosylaminoimidazole-succinocarboxamide synthase
MIESRAPLPLWRRGKVRDVYDAGAERLLIVASDRVSAFDVVMQEAVPDKGRVLTQLSAFWFERLRDIVPSHFISANIGEIIAAVPALDGHAEALAGRSMLVRRTVPVDFECVVRGYLSGSAWAEYRESGTLAGEALPAGLRQSEYFADPIFSPATKAVTGHDQNVPFSTMAAALAPGLADRLRQLSLALYQGGRDIAAARGIIVADTKFEFGLDGDGQPVLIDELLTPDSSRFWAVRDYAPGGAPPSFDKQPLRDWLARERAAGRWNGNPPPPALPSEVIAAASQRYREAYRLLTDRELESEASCV